MIDVYGFEMHGRYLRERAGHEVAEQALVRQAREATRPTGSTAGNDACIPRARRKARPPIGWLRAKLAA